MNTAQWVMLIIGYSVAVLGVIKAIRDDLNRFERRRPGYGGGAHFRKAPNQDGKPLRRGECDYFGNRITRRNLWLDGTFRR